MKLKHACVDAGQYGLNIAATEYVDQGVRLVRTTDLASGRLSDPSEGIFVPDDVEERFLLEPGDLLLSRSGTVGRAFLTPRAAAGSTFAGFLVRFRPLPSTDPRFLAYVAQSSPFQDRVRTDSVVSTIQNFNADRYANIEIPDVCPSSQARIADFLDDQVSRIDNIIAARRQQVVETHESFRSMSERLLWTMMRPMPLKYLVESVTSGPRGWGDFVADSGRPFIRIANLSPLGIDLRLENLVKVDPPSGAEVERASVRRGDVLLSITATMGSVGIVESTEEATFSQHVGRIRPSSMGDSRWIAWVLQSRSMLDHFSLNAYGGGKVGLGLDQIRNLPVPTVVPLRRTEISTAIDRAWSITESGVSGLERSVKLLAEYKQSLITAAVTGEFDVTTARKGIAT